MIICDDCYKCKYGWTVKCASGDEYVCCDNQECQEEKKEVKKNESSN